MTAGVVIEIRKHLQAFARAVREPVCPFIQALIRIPAAVLLRAEVKSNVHERTNDHLAARRALHVVQAERDVVATHQLEHALVIPARFTEFERVPIPARQRSEK